MQTAVKVDQEKNLVRLKVVDGKLKKKELYNKDGSVKRTRCNKEKGVSSEVYGFQTKEEIDAIMMCLNKHIVEAYNEDKKRTAYRNRLLFLIGMNIGIRGSDLRTLKWNFFFNKDGSWKEFYSLSPKKQSGKFVKLFFNNTVKNAILQYIKEYPIKDYDDYIFASRKGGEPILVSTLWKIVKNTAEEAGIKKNIGSHSLRKTWGYWCWHNSPDKQKALVVLQKCFNHSSTLVTMKYIGLMDGEIADMFYSIELGENYCQ